MPGKTPLPFFPHPSPSRPLFKKVWDYRTTPEHILRWNNPSNEWKTTSVENDVLKQFGDYVAQH